MAGFTLQQVLKAQQALRAAAGLPPEEFPLEAFVGMISDEIEILRSASKTDAEITELIRRSSSIDIDEATLAANYAPPEERSRRG